MVSFPYGRADAGSLAAQNEASKSWLGAGIYRDYNRENIGYTQETEGQNKEKEVVVISKISPLQIPDQLRSSEKAWPIIYIEARNLDLWNAPTSLAYFVGDVLNTAVQRVHEGPIQGQALLKVHIGEPNCHTRMRPEYVMGISKFLSERGASGIVGGGTTVAYSGPRGHRENPKGSISKYHQLARKHGWSKNGKFGSSFVVLDRPSTSKPEKFKFVAEQKSFELDGVNRFNDFYAAGGLTAADLVVNNAHLTPHGLASVAGCVKSIAMGCSGLTGKLRMHQSLLPHFNTELCVNCRKCVESFPENALQLNEGDICPTVDTESCIGCVECEAVCTVGKGAIKLSGEEITDWERGAEILPIRMVDYTIGLMNGKWDKTIHVLHMYAITERCECLDIKQQPMFKRDLSFLVGKNPFAIDRLAAQILAEALNKEGRAVDESLLKSVETTAGYICENYGILTEVPVERMAVL